MEFLTFMAAPTIMGLVLVGIHGYLGLHVVRRGVIFVDIAVAQASAFGAALALAFGVELGTSMSKTAGLAAALLAAWVISMTRTRRETIPQEAFIGVTFAVASAGTILVLVGVPHGGEEIRNLLIGSILWVRWIDVLETGALYAVIGVFHYVFRERFNLVTESPTEARRRGYNVRWWDFLFYASLGVVVTSSVQVAGVLLVFTLLVVPAIMAIQFTESLSRRLLVGWGLGALLATVGMILSYVLDLPPGATIVCTFGIALAILTPIRFRKGEL
jgi:zinc/manganese transport system permease protein